MQTANMDSWVSRFENWRDVTATRAILAKLVKAIADGFRPLLDRTMAEFDDRSLYPERPMIRIGGRAVNEPVLWFLGWRQGDATPIHDHEKSEVAIIVLKDVVTERIWWPNAEITKDAFTKTQRIERELHRGSVVTIPAPYIHIFHNPTPTLAVTLHAYFPALDHMIYYEEGTDPDSPCLRMTGRWDDDLAHLDTCVCPHDANSCGDRGCHLNAVCAV